MGDMGEHWYLAIGASCALSAFTTWLAILYAHRRNLFDQPGQRRSHSAPTPRGGGIGIVVAMLAFFCVPLLLSPETSTTAFGAAVTVALLIVATVGWIDDHRSLSARIRFCAHAIAAMILLALPLASDLVTMQRFVNDIPISGSAVLLASIIFLCVAVVIVWSINLHNFMDGINGLLACQAAFVFFVLGALTSVPEYSNLLWVLSAATLGFLPFNFPRARIFMGDVGSGALGLMIVVAIGLTLNTIRPPLGAALIVCSAFATDATCTLLSRMLRGRRWYSSHREHLYQWMARSGMSHARVVAWYMAWNLCVVVPVLWWVCGGWSGLEHAWSPSSGLTPISGSGDAMALAWHSRASFGAPLVVYVLATATWLFGKRWCLHKVKNAIKQEI